MSYPGFRNWVPKIGNCKTFGHPTFQLGPQYTQILTMKMYKLIEIRHNNNLMQCDGNYMLEIDILRNSSQNKFRCPKG